MENERKRKNIEEGSVWCCWRGGGEVVEKMKTDTDSKRRKRKPAASVALAVAIAIAVELCLGVGNL